MTCLNSPHDRLRMRTNAGAAADPINTPAIAKVIRKVMIDARSCAFVLISAGMAK